MYTRIEIKNYLLSIMQGLHFTTNEIPESTHLKAEMGLDSLDIVELVSKIELKFGIEVPDAICARFSTFEFVIDYVLEVVNEKHFFLASTMNTVHLIDSKIKIA
jgi:acyl carrier protein